jgi:hypothetical protein
MRKIKMILKRMFRGYGLSVTGSVLKRTDDYSTSLMRGDEYGC